MTARTAPGTPTPRALPAPEADHHDRVPQTAAPPSSLEYDMHFLPEQLARNHLDQRRAEVRASQLRRVALAARRAEQAERRARLAREAAVLAVRESAYALAR